MISDLEKLKKKMIEKPWLYEEEEHAVLKLAEEAIQFIKDSRNRGDTSAMFSLFVTNWLKDHEG